MLVLSRKSEQSIQIGDNIRVTILRVKGNRVRVGVEAPEQVHIMRGELEQIARGWDDATSEDSLRQELEFLACR